jgi:hypothetical protein
MPSFTVKSRWGDQTQQGGGIRAKATGRGGVADYDSEASVSDKQYGQLARASARARQMMGDAESALADFDPAARAESRLMFGNDSEATRAAAAGVFGRGGTVLAGYSQENFAVNTVNTKDLAYVNVGDPTRITVTGAFFDMSVDSQAYVLIHEVSHFNVVGGTGDLGITLFDTLALGRQGLGLQNADSYAAFAWRASNTVQVGACAGSPCSYQMW